MTQKQSKSTKVNFVQVDSLRKHMLLTVSDMSKVLGVSRETYYTWLADEGYPRPKREVYVKERVRQLLLLLTEKDWPPPHVIASSQKERLSKLLDVIGRGV